MRDARMAGTQPRISSPRGEQRWFSEQALALAFGLLAFLVRALYLIESAGNPFRHNLGLDPANYDRWARAILSGTPFGPDPFFQAPLYPYFVAGCYALLGTDPTRPLWIHAVLGAATTYLGARIGHRYWGRPGLIAVALLLALYKPAIFYTGVLLVPVLAAFLLAVALWFAPRHALLTGLVIGLAGLAHPVLLPGGLLAGLVLARGNAPAASVPAQSDSRGRRAWPPWHGARTWIPARATLLRMALGVLLAILPATLHNLAVSGRFVPLSVNSGINLYIGNGPDANGFYRSPFGMRGEQDPLGIAEAARQAGRALDPFAANRFWTHQAQVAMRADAGRAIGLFLRKLYFAFSAYETPQIESLDFEKRYSRLLQIPILPNWILLLALSALALLVVRPRRLPGVCLAATFVTALAIAVYFVTGRFRMPAHVFLAIAAGGGIATLIRELRARDATVRRRAVTGAVIATGVVLVFTPNWFAVSRSLSNAQYHYRLGVIAEERDDVSAAKQEYASALAIDPNIARANVNLGILTARAGNLAQARPLLERGVALDPRSARGYLALGQLRQMEGDLAAACSLYARSWAADTTFATSLEFLTTATYLCGDLEQTHALAVHLFSVIGQNAPLAARVLFIMGRISQRQHYGLPLRGSPARAEGDVAFAAGDLRAADIAYARALGDDPNDPVAWLERARIASLRREVTRYADYRARYLASGGALELLEEPEDF
jgi:Tfp pilus assembly protein PilF